MTEIHANQTISPGGLAERLFAPDALRGLIIAWMALDHANIFVAHKHSSGEYWGGAFPVYYDTLAFLTRFVTHFCAPGFFLLMGVGMALFAHSRQERGWSKRAVIQHFLIRGGAILAIKLLVVNQIWKLMPGGWGIQIYIGVLFALGATMILGSLLLWLKPAYLLGLALVLLVGTELLVPDPSQWGPTSNWLSLVLLTPGGMLNSSGGTLLWSNYPVLPWLELVAFGIALGKWLADNPAQAYSRAWKLGLAFLAAFIVIRYLDGFGNIRPRLSNSWTDFLNPVKYPPSITFTLLTGGVNLILLWLFSRLQGWAQRITQPLTVFGKAPLFFYVTHLLLYAGHGRLLAPDGSSLLAMYPVWLFGLLALYPLCLWYRQLKRWKAVRPVLQYL
ncbi:MAG TPA: heparan-alpha-glucosaminide N-acetyltransferase domain-containing protein [Anaerolineales bacterium]|nr:heparan-alpha-glucosaminide N-acetyltransferase domain-containing protein [Anaerolineales bacterium]